MKKKQEKVSKMAETVSDNHPNLNKNFKPSEMLVEFAFCQP